MSDRANHGLKPTLWRTCRVLANKKRLMILRAIIMRPGLTVTQVSHGCGMSMSVASKYLRELNARGLLKATRRKSEVRYWPEADKSMKQSSALLAAISATFRGSRAPISLIFREATAFTHPRRIALVRELARQPSGFAGIRKGSGMSVTSLKRHLGKLVSRGIVHRVPACGLYALAIPKSALERTFLELAQD